MSLRIIYTFFTLALGAYIFLGNSSGAALVQGLDRTGGPLASGFCGNNGCHAGEAFDPSISITMMQDGAPVENYTPGTTYTLRVEITAGNGEPGGYGFQLVALDAGNAGVGTLNPSANTQVVPVGGISYIEQTSPNEDNNFFEFEWVAPDMSAGAVTFYAAGNAVDRNSSSSGDGAASTSLSVAEMNVSIFNVELLPVAVQVNPNPIQDKVNIFMESDITAELQLNIFDLSGKRITQSLTRVVPGQNNLQLDASNWNVGTYILQLTDGEKVISKKIVKL